MRTCGKLSRTWSFPLRSSPIYMIRTGIGSRTGRSGTRTELLTCVCRWTSHPTTRVSYFQVIEDKLSKSPVSEHQTKAGAEQSFKAWESDLLYFRPGPVIELLRVFKRRSGGDLPISQNDLLNQMKTRSYWHPSKHPSGHRQKFGGKSNQSCWCIKVDLHPLGLIPVSDAEFDESFIQDAERKSMFTADSWVDPRKGDLFALIESLHGKHHEED